MPASERNHHGRLSDGEVARCFTINSPTARCGVPEPDARSGRYRHVATVMNALKLPAGGVLKGPISVLQNQEWGLREPYDVGQEAVLFLKSWNGDFVITNDNPGLKIRDEVPAMAFLIQNGRIEHAPPGFNGYVGKQIAAFLDELRALSRRR